MHPYFPEKAILSKERLGPDFCEFVNSHFVPLKNALLVREIMTEDPEAIRCSRPKP